MVLNKSHYLFIGWHEVGTAMFGDQDCTTGISQASSFVPIPSVDKTVQETRGKCITSAQDVFNLHRETWDLDLHYPKEQYAKATPDNPFISRAAFGKGVDKRNGYPVPYRCFYSKTVPNLFMAGRCISVNHEALGTVRVMRTCGMMGEVVGKAA